MPTVWRTLPFLLFPIVSFAQQIPFCPRTIVEGESAGDSNSLYAADLDGDSDEDILFGVLNDGKIQWHENLGGSPPEFAPHTVYISNVNQGVGVFAEDMDGDGDMDIVAAFFVEDSIRWFESDGNTPPTFSPQTIANNVDGPTGLFVADLNGDNDMDVLSTFFVDDTLVWYENDGAIDPVFLEHVISDTLDGAHSVASEDLDGDTHIDVVAGNFLDGKIHWFESDGADPPEFVPHLVTITSGVRSLSLDDLDRDNDVDILSASEVDDTIAWYENDGTAVPSFTKYVISNSEVSAYSVSTSDINLDGDIDVVSASFLGGEVAWFESNGSTPPGFVRHLVSRENDGLGGCGSADFSRSMVVADLDQDQDDDIVAASHFFSGGTDGGGMRWYENRSPWAGCTAGAAEQLRMAVVSGELRLTWGKSCIPTDSDYAVYEGLIADFGDYQQKLCSTGSATSVTVPMPTESSYYIVVANNASCEGSYGFQGNGTERPQADSACLQRDAICTCTCQ